MLEIIIFAAALIMTAGGVSIFKRLGITARLIDVPNERSSHRKPTVRGAGVVMVLVCLGLFVLVKLALGTEIQWAFLIASSFVAIISWIDDIYSLPASLRFVAHGLAAVVLVLGSGYFSSGYIPGSGVSVHLGSVGSALTIVWIIWMINAYNFMDGIDGIAGVQAVIGGAGWAVIGIIAGDSSVYLFGGIVAFSALGFLVHNWQPASVFMGDVGSAFLGFTFASIPIMSHQMQTELQGWLFTAAVGVIWLFWMDAAYTFIRRLYRGEKFWQAHREHLYQRLVISGSAHSRVSLVYGGLGTAVITALVLAIKFGGIFEFAFLAAVFLSAIVVIALAHRKND